MQMLIRTLPFLLIALLLAPALRAEEDAEANARRFLDSLTNVRAEALGRHTLHLRAVGVPSGRMELNIEQVSMDGKPCYRIQSITDIEAPGGKSSTHALAYLDTHLRVIWGQSTERDGRNLKAESTTTRTGEGILFQRKKSNEDELKRVTYQPHERLLDGYAEEVAALLLAASRTGTYAFLQWDAEAGDFAPLTIAVNRDSEFEGRRATHIRMTGERAKTLRGGLSVTRERDFEYWIVGGEFAHIAAHHDSLEVSPKPLPAAREEISVETLEALDTAESAVMLFLVGMARRDESMLRSAMDSEAVARRALQENEQTRGMPEEMLEEFLPSVIEMVLAALLGQQEDGSVEDLEFSLVLAAFICRHRGVLKMQKAANGETLVGPALDLPKGFHDDFPWFVVKQDSEERWRIVHLYQGNRPPLKDEEEADKPEEMPEAPKEEDF
jgi:hypothetical protein